MSRRESSEVPNPQAPSEPRIAPPAADEGGEARPEERFEQEPVAEASALPGSEAHAKEEVPVPGTGAAAPPSGVAPITSRAEAPQEKDPPGLDAAAPPKADGAVEAWSPSVKFGVFADSYVSYNSSATGTSSAYHLAYANNTPYDPVGGFPLDANGDPAGPANRSLFGLSFAGLDASFEAGPVGATLLLRFGPSVPIYYGTDTGVAGLDSLLAGYATVRPVRPLTIDVGYFGSIYGTEVAESWRNANYSRGALYFVMQPFYHFGVRANYVFNDFVAVNMMAVNGANDIADENDAPAFGAQVLLKDKEGALALSLGGFYELGDDSIWGIESFADVVLALNLGDFHWLTNGDFNVDRGGVDGKSRDQRYWGVASTARYDFTPDLGTALRGEYLSDPDNAVWTIVGAKNFNLQTVTATVNWQPFAHFFFRPELRYERASESIFFDRQANVTDGWFSATIGIVATTD